MPKPSKDKKSLSTKEFAEQQLKEIKDINDKIRRRTRKLILIAFATNLILVAAIVILSWYLQNQ